MLTSLVAQCILSLTIRVFCENNIKFRNEETAGRLTSIVHSLGTAYFILNKRNEDSILSTLFGLSTDFILNHVYGNSLRVSSFLHHFAGIGLCVFSLINKTYQDHVWTPITMSLVSMEMTNPIVHLSIICHDEYLALFHIFKIPLSALTLSAWTYFRIWNLGKEAINLIRTTPSKYFLHWYVHCVFILCGMQIYWLFKLFNAAIKK
jgi:hypothetical protein